jgi:hypothetical protein
MHGKNPRALRCAIILNITVIRRTATVVVRKKLTFVVGINYNIGFTKYSSAVNISDSVCS